MSMEMSGEDQTLAENAAKEITEHHEKLALAWREVAKSGAGKFCLEDLSKRCNANNSCIRSIAHPDANSVLVEEGKRAVFNYIMSYVRHDGEQGKAR